MKPSVRFIFAAGLVMLLALSLPSPLAAQEALTEKYTSADETFTLRYPEGWTVRHYWSTGLYTLGNDDITLLIVEPTTVADAIGDEAGDDLNATLLGFLDALEIGYEEPVEAELEGREAALADITFQGYAPCTTSRCDRFRQEAAVAHITFQGEPGTALGLRFKDEGIGVLLISGSEAALEEAEPTLMAIAATFDSPSPATSTCMVRTDQARTVRVRVGFGENRTAVTFLETDTEFEVLGQNTDDSGATWYALDKEEVAPGKSIRGDLAWVAAAEVEATGDCDAVPVMEATNPIPIVTPAPEGEGSASVTHTVTGSGAVPTGHVVGMSVRLCQNVMTAPVGQPLVLRFGWVTASDVYRSLYLDSARHTLTFDRQGIPLTAMQTWTHEKGPAIYYYWQIPAPAPGSHEAVFVRDMPQPIPDGFDLNGDGVLETYSSLTFTCTIVVK